MIVSIGARHHWYQVVGDQVLAWRQQCSMPADNGSVPPSLSIIDSGVWSGVVPGGGPGVTWSQHGSQHDQRHDNQPQQSDFLPLVATVIPLAVTTMPMCPV